MRDNRSLFGAICGAALLVLAAPALAEDSVSDLAEQAVAENPSLVAMEAKERALQQSAAVAGAWPDPMLMLEYSNVPVSSLGLSDHPMAGLQFKITQTLRPARWSQLQQDIGISRADSASHMTQEAALQLRASVHRTWWLLTRSRLLEDVTREHLARTEELLSSARIRYETGSLGQHAVLRLEVLRDRLFDELEDYQRNDHVLSAALGEALGGNLYQTYDTPTVPSLLAPPEQDWMQLALEHRPLLKSLTSQLETEMKSAELARVDGRPDVSVWAGYRLRTVETELDSGADLVSVGVGIPLPIGSARRADGAEAAAQERAHGVESLYRAALNDINAEMASIRAIWSRAFSKAQTYREQLIPESQAVLETTLSDFSVGRAEFAALFEAEVTLLNLERAWIIAATETHIQNAETIGVIGVSSIGDEP